MPTTLISDTFTAPDGTPIDGRVPAPTAFEGNAWINPFGNLEIQSGQVVNTFFDTRRAVVDCGSPDGTVSALMTLDGFGEGHLLIRMSEDLQTGYELTVIVDFAGTAYNAFLYRFDGGSETQLATRSGVWPAGVPVTCSLAVAGDELTALIGSDELIATDSTYTAETFCGFAEGPAGLQTLDNFLMESGSMADAVVISTPLTATSHLRTIAMTGTYDGAPVSIEASFNNGPWTVIDDTLSGNVWSGTVPYDHPGTGTLSVRWSNNHAITASVAAITVTSHTAIPAAIARSTSMRPRRRQP